MLGIDRFLSHLKGDSMKRLIATVTVLGVGLSAALLTPLAGAAPAPVKVIEDPAGDANFLNDQGTGDGSKGDQVTPADVSSVTDLLEVNIANDKKNVYVTFVTEVAPPATQGVGFRLRANPDGPGGTNCLFVEAFYPGAGNTLDAAEAYVRDTCAGGQAIAVEVLSNQVIIPRKSLAAFKKGSTIKGPQAHGFIYVGSSYPAGAAYPVVDTTKVGTDYKLKG
jgi:hypothetical protein